MNSERILSEEDFGQKQPKNKEENLDSFLVFLQSVVKV